MSQLIAVIGGSYPRSMRVMSLWRYPVKSMFGEGRSSIDCGDRGVDGDRRFGVLDLASGTILSAKRYGRLLEARSFLAGVTLTIRLPTGETLLGTGPSVDLALSAWLGRPVRLVEVRPEGRGTYEVPSDFEDDDSTLKAFEGPSGSFVDSAPVHLLTTASIRAMATERADLQWDTARFRPNVVVDVGGEALAEQDWIGRRLAVGEVELEIYKPCERCVMTTRPQPGGIERQLDVLRHINTAHQSNLGVLASVIRGGRISVGDVPSLLT
jgi:uncharacterized protein YcbX